MKSLNLTVCLILTLSAGDAFGQDVVKPPAPASKLLKGKEVDPRRLLAPPPPEGSSAAAAEIAELHAIALARTPARLARAQHDAEVENVTAIAEPLGSGFDLTKLPKTEKLFSDLRYEESLAAKTAKKIFQRPRPWEADASLNTGTHLAGCDKGAPKTSYPSGHSTMGWAAAEVLAELIPSRAQDFLQRADEYAESRLVCGVHYRRDIEASHVLATAVVKDLMDQPGFRAELEDARTELTQAHLAP